MAACPSVALAPGVRPIGVRRRRGARSARVAGGRGIGSHRAIDEAGEARGSRHALVEHELQPRRMPQPKLPAELPAQEAGRAREPAADLRGAVRRRRTG